MSTTTITPISDDMAKEVMAIAGAYLAEVKQVIITEALKTGDHMPDDVIDNVILAYIYGFEYE